MKNKTKTFDFPAAFRQLQLLESDFDLAEPGSADRKAKMRRFGDASAAFSMALKTLPAPRRCKHAVRQKTAAGNHCIKCGVKFVDCTGGAHSPEVGGMQDHCMVCLPWGWGEVPEHKENEDIDAMVKAFIR